jgi:hypothetical protein
MLRKLSMPRKPRGAAGLVPADSLLPFFTVRAFSGYRIGCNAGWARTRGWGRVMRRKLRKTLPFLMAIFLGTMAAALIAGMAMLAAHS